MKKEYKSILLIYIFLSLGTLIYILFRPPLSWFPSIPDWDKAVVNISFLPSLISSFILYHLSDVMWALALSETIFLIKKNLLLSITTVFILTVMFESLQFLKIVKGTGDIWDVIYVTIFLSIYYFIKKRSWKNEKKS